MGDFSSTKDPAPGLEMSPSEEEQPSQLLDQNTSTKAAPIEPERQPIPPRLDGESGTYNAFSSQFDLAQPSAPAGRSRPFHMSQMANTLPYTQYQPNQFPQGPPQQYGQHASPAMMSHMGHNPQFLGPHHESMAPQGYYMTPHQMPPYYNVDTSINNAGHLPMQQRQNIAYYGPQVIMGQTQPAPYYVQLPHYAEQHQHSLPQQHQHMPSPTMPAQFARGQPITTARRPSQRASNRRNRPNHDNPKPIGDNKKQNVVRGPPRKPRQSGNAIWIGNLPPQTDLMNLVHHVCNETPGLQSLFLISKSNCAFANFSDEEACLEAQRILHDSKFQSVRLVCRLRKNSAEGTTGVLSPTGHSGSNPASPVPDASPPNESDTEGREAPILVVGQRRPSETKTSDDKSPRPDRFFVLKSLTLEDLDLSVRTGVWATQAHNEESLNHAFKNSDNVYLIFSANKSGEYFGYARMTSEINQNPEAAIQFAPKTYDVDETQSAKEVPTEANDKTPKGRIVDDSARGTIFWEADTDESDGELDEEEIEEDEAANRNTPEVDEDIQTSGKPFNLMWLSTNRVPFHRTRGLRNSWNSNREVKIARDGTELEPATGRRLVALFHYGTNHGSSQEPRGSIARYTAMGGYGS